MTKTEVYLASSTKYSAEGAHENDLTPGGDVAALDDGVTKVLRPV